MVAVTPPEGPIDPELLDVWIAAGVPSRKMAVLLREPGRGVAAALAPDGRLGPLARACEQRGIRVLISSDVNDLDAIERVLDEGVVEGVQLRGDPNNDDLKRARERLGGSIVGRSVHESPPLEGESGNSYVNYTCLAPVFQPGTPNGQPKKTVGLDTLHRWLGRRGSCVFTLGGMSPRNAALCLSVGAYGLAGISPFFGPKDVVTDTVGKLWELLKLRGAALS